jgi:WD40 repeat protein
MADPSLRRLLERLRKSQFLDEKQLTEVRNTLAPASADAATLARTLVQRGWLTPHQAKRLLQPTQPAAERDEDGESEIEDKEEKLARPGPPAPTEAEEPLVTIIAPASTSLRRSSRGPLIAVAVVVGVAVSSAGIYLWTRSNSSDKAKKVEARERSEAGVRRSDRRPLGSDSTEDHGKLLASEPKGAEKPSVPKRAGQGSDQAGKPKAPARAAVPDAGAQDAALKTVRDLFKEEYARKDQADRVALAAKLLQKGKETTDDPAGRYVLFNEARELAAKVGEVEAALRAANEMARAYTIQPLAVKTDTLVRASDALQTPAAQQAMVDSSLHVMDEALAQDQFDSAWTLVSLAEAAAFQLGNSQVLATVQQRSQDLKDWQEEYEEVREAEQTLKKQPKEPDASLVVGSYRCFRKGQWERGLPLLAQCDDADLQAAAAKELARPSDAAAQVELADRWWELAQADHAGARAMRRRALYWYQRALPRLTGLTQTRVEKRVREGEPKATPVAAASSLQLSPSEVRRIVGHTGPVLCVAIAADGTRALSGSADNTIRFWDVESGKELNQLKGHQGLARTVALSPDGRWAMAGGQESWTLWQLEAAPKLRRAGRGSEISCVRFSPDSRYAYMAGARGSLTSMAVEPGKSRGGISNPDWGTIRSLTAPADDRLALLVGEDGVVYAFDWDAHKKFGAPLRARAPFVAVSFAPDGKQFATAGADRAIRIWNFTTGKEVRQFRGHQGPITGLCYSPDGRRLLSCGEDRTVRLWDAKSGQELQRLTGHTDKIWAVVFTPDGKHALSASSDQTLRLWELVK